MCLYVFSFINQSTSIPHLSQFILIYLPAVYRWEEKDGDDSLKCDHATSSLIEITDDLNTSSESAEAGRKVTVSVCGDHQHKEDVEEKDSVVRPITTLLSLT